MVTVKEASAIISDNLFLSRALNVDLDEAVGKVLAEPVRADRDLPPFNRVSMDGIAIQYKEWLRGTRAFHIRDIQAAGEEPKTLSDSAGCVEVMTGAVLPVGCDVVIRYEDVEISDKNAIVRVDTVEPLQSIHRQGMDARKDEILLEPGQRLAPSEIALLASVGKSKVSVFSLPRVAIISTGDELVGVGDLPLAWQIRRSNSHSLQSALKEMAAESVCFHLEDEKSIMRNRLEAIIREFDVLILSGGVSKGRFDFVPEVLEEIGIHKLFHQVSQRPGKPFWFGASASGKIAFALPGNPVSTFMCFYKYVKPWIMKSLHAKVSDSLAILGKDFSFLPQLTCFLQVNVSNEDGRLIAHPMPGGGSGDFANLKTVSGFLELPLEKNEFKAGQVYPYIAFRQ
jgi:molybdopterin molybdotransferase